MHFRCGLGGVLHHLGSARIDQRRSLRPLGRRGQSKQRADSGNTERTCQDFRG